MKARLLIVDDEEEIRQMLARHFSLQDFETETVPNGREALDALSIKRYDLIISDIRMPVMDGVELLRAVRDHYPMVRMIMVTGYVTMENALACMRRGADTVVFKPLTDMAELDEAVRDSLRILERWQQKLRDLKGMRPE